MSEGWCIGQNYCVNIMSSRFMLKGHRRPYSPWAWRVLFTQEWDKITKDCEEKIHLFYGVIITQFSSGLLTDYKAFSHLSAWPVSCRFRIFAVCFNIFHPVNVIDFHKHGITFPVTEMSFCEIYSSPIGFVIDSRVSKNCTFWCPQQYVHVTKWLTSYHSITTHYFLRCLIIFRSYFE